MRLASSDAIDQYDPLEVADEQGYGRDEDGYPALHFALPRS